MLAPRLPGDSIPLWTIEGPAPSWPPLEDDLEADVCVIGAGFAGLSCAYELASAGRSVVVVDAHGPATGQSALTTAHLTAVLDSRFSELEALHGPERARLAVESHVRAIDRVEAIVAAERLDCAFSRVDGYLFSGLGADPALLESELAAARRCGLEAVASAERAPLGRAVTGPALRFPQQAQLQPVRYLAGLASAVSRLGGRLFTVAARAVEDGSPARVVTEGGATVRAGAVIVATAAPINDRVALQTWQYPYRTYAVAFEPPASDVETALYWDMDEPYHYVRLHEGRLIVGGEDHKTGHAADAPERYARLERWARERVPGLGAVSHRWSGQVIEPADGLAFIGRNPGEAAVFVVTGHSGNGTTYGALGGLLLADLIAGRPSRYAALYSPERAPAGWGRWLDENVDAALQYARYAAPAEVSSVEEIAPDSGALLRRGALKHAVYKDPDGVVTELSAVCPHLGGPVCWNAAEKSWDCPVHGSRFSPTGAVLNGPACEPLPPAGEPPSPPSASPPPRPPDAPTRWTVGPS